MHLIEKCDIVGWLSSFFKNLLVSGGKKHSPVAGHMIYVVQVTSSFLSPIDYAPHDSSLYYIR
jgi:hypothetical protein